MCKTVHKYTIKERLCVTATVIFRLLLIGFNCYCTLGPESLHNSDLIIAAAAECKQKLEFPLLFLTVAQMTCESADSSDAPADSYHPPLSDVINYFTTPIENLTCFQFNRFPEQPKINDL